jgi:hypothetical protein
MTPLILHAENRRETTHRILNNFLIKELAVVIAYFAIAWHSC